MQTYFDQIALQITPTYWFNEYRAYFQKRDHKHINYGQTGRVYKTKRSYYFVPDADNNSDQVYQVDKKDLFNLHKV